MSPRFARLLAAPLAVLALAAGAAAAAPVASASIRPSCVWQPLNLLNGWQSAQGEWNTGDPAYCVDGGVVYLSGSLTNPSSGGAEFAVLPTQALPTSNLFLNVYTFGGTYGQLSIGSGGALYANGSSAYRYTSLAGISFPVAGTALQSLFLLPGWMSAQTVFGTGNPSEAVVNGIVYLTGSMRNPQNSEDVEGDFGFDAVMPPDRCYDTFVYTYKGNIGSLVNWPPAPPPQQDRFQSVSDTTVLTNYSATFTSLAGVTYPQAGQASWQSLALQTGWSAYNPYSSYCITGDAPSYYIQDHVVYLSGELTQNGSNLGGVFATLPAAARPQHDLWLMTGHSYLHISPNGDMHWSGGDGNLSLADISYQTSS